MKPKMLNKQAKSIVETNKAIALEIAEYFGIGYDYFVRTFDKTSSRLTEIGVLMIINQHAKVKDITTLVCDKKL